MASIKKIEKLLRHVLLEDGDMAYALYEHELEEVLDHLKESMVEDNDDFIFTVTENRGDAAMVLMEKSGKLYVNEQARERLKVLWPAAYESNMRLFVPVFARQLSAGELPINGVKIVDP